MKSDSRAGEIQDTCGHTSPIGRVYLQTPTSSEVDLSYETAEGLGVWIVLEIINCSRSARAPAFRF